MATGMARIFKTATGGPYAYTWVDEAGQLDLDAVVTGKTLAQAYSEIGTLAQAMVGTIRSVDINVVSS